MTVLQAIWDKANPPLQKAIDGLFQAFAVRAAGFSIVPLSETAPALQFLYVVMMVSNARLLASASSAADPRPLT